MGDQPSDFITIGIGERGGRGKMVGTLPLLPEISGTVVYGGWEGDASRAAPSECGVGVGVRARASERRR